MSEVSMQPPGPVLREADECVDKVLIDLVDANHILFHEKVVDGFGHISVRDPRDPQSFLLSRSMAPALVEVDDIMRFDLTGAALDGDERPAYLERFLHAAIYRVRSDVVSIIHSHSNSVIPFGVSKTQRLRPVCHMGGFLGAGPSVFEIRDAAGPATDLLIRNIDLGDALARRLADESVVLMRGHGSTTVGASIRQAVFRAIYTGKSASILSASLQLGAVECLTVEEAQAAARANDSQIDRPWLLWKMAADAARAGRFGA